MASATSPSGIVYPDATDPVAPLNTVFKDLADSVQDAFNNMPSQEAEPPLPLTFMLMGA